MINRYSFLLDTSPKFLFVKDSIWFLRICTYSVYCHFLYILLHKFKAYWPQSFELEIIDPQLDFFQLVLDI